eukprot:336333-Pelagomonas_calceolata.AAC.1
MDIMLTGEDQSQADQPSSLAEGPVQICKSVMPRNLAEQGGPTWHFLCLASTGSPGHGLSIAAEFVK